MSISPVSRPIAPATPTPPQASPAEQARKPIAPAAKSGADSDGDHDGSAARIKKA